MLQEPADAVKALQFKEQIVVSEGAQKYTTLLIFYSKVTAVPLAVTINMLFPDPSAS